jgi:hypothetical protein
MLSVIIGVHSPPAAVNRGEIEGSVSCVQRSSTHGSWLARESGWATGDAAAMRAWRREASS